MSTTAFTDGSTLTAASWFNDIDTTVYSVLSSVAGTNTITAGGPINLAAYSNGNRWWLTPAATNTGATTLNITPSGGAALGARNIFWRGAALTGGELMIGVPTMLVDDGTQLNLIGPQVSGSETKRAASWKFTTWNPSDIAGTESPPTDTAAASVTATNFITMASSSGVLTFTFAKAGTYLVTMFGQLQANANFTAGYFRTNLGGSCTRLSTPNSNYAYGSPNLSFEQCISFLVSATAAQTLTVAPNIAITLGGGTTTNYPTDYCATAAYMGV